MRFSTKLAVLGMTLVVIAAAPNMASAQRPHAGARPVAAGRPNARRAAHGTPEQQAWFKAYVAERKSLATQVKAGTLDKKGAVAALKTWREANKPPKKP